MDLSIRISPQSVITQTCMSVICNGQGGQESITIDSTTITVDSNIITADRT